MVCRQPKNYTKYSLHTLVNFPCFPQKGVYKTVQQKKYIYMYMYIKAITIKSTFTQMTLYSIIVCTVCAATGVFDNITHFGCFLG